MADVLLGLKQRRDYTLIKTTKVEVYFLFNLMKNSMQKKTPTANLNMP